MENHLLSQAIFHRNLLDYHRFHPYSHFMYLYIYIYVYNNDINNL